MFSNFESLVLYLFVAFSSYLFFTLAKQERKHHTNSPLTSMALFLSIVIPSVFAGLRYNVGTDYANYNYIMSAIRELPLKQVFELQNMEFGYVLLVKLLTTFFSNPIVFGIISAITLTIVVHTLQTQYKDADCGMMYFIYLFQYYFFSYNIVRQNIAMAIIFFSLKYIYQHKLGKFILCVIASMLFHYSAIAFVPAYFLWNKPKKLKIKTGGKVFIGIIVLLLTVNFRRILSFLIGLGIPYISKYLYLINDSASNQNRDIIVKILFLIIFLIVRKTIHKYHEDSVYFIDLYAISVVIGFTGFYTAFFKRAAYYYAFPEIVLMSRIPKIAATPGQRYVLRWIIMIAFVLLFILSAYILQQADLIPYKTIFELPYVSI